MFHYQKPLAFDNEFIMNLLYIYIIYTVRQLQKTDVLVQHKALVNI